MGAGHLPKGVKFYVIGGGLGLLGLVFGLPQTHPARVVMTQTADYLAQRVEQLPEMAPASAGLAAILPGHGPTFAAGQPGSTVATNPNPPQTGQPVASVTASSNNSAPSTAATVASLAPVSIATPSIDAGSVTVSTAAPTTAPATTPPPTVVPTIPNPIPVPIPIPVALPPPTAPVSVPAVDPPPTAAPTPVATVAPPTAVPTTTPTPTP